MKLSPPLVGQVISYDYLWRDEAVGGKAEGRKTRPCVIVLAAAAQAADTVVTVVPVTHVRPAPSTLAIEIPAATKARLGLDDQPSWVIVTEVNRFTWPGYDLKPTRRGADTCVFGQSPKALFDLIRAAVLESARRGRLQITSRE